MQVRSRLAVAGPLLSFITALLFTIAMQPEALYYYIVAGVVFVAMLQLGTRNPHQFKVKEVWWSMLVCVLLGSLAGFFITR
ncbi:MAG TPA: hypothetical protein VGP82_00930 [Ktedonobacterales bacterium]|jgi:hypothetical protein|nr:hypothetical protein [Ktedonobacterales bacterium]